MNPPSKTFLYGVPVTDPELAMGETAAYRPPGALNGFLDHIPRLPHVKTVQDLNIENAKTYTDLNCLGTRVKNPDGTFGEYEWKSYGTIYENARKIGSAIFNLDLAPITQADGYPPCRLVALFGKNSEAWVTTDLACSLFGITSIPIFHSLGLGSLPYIFQHTEVETMFTTANHLNQLIEDASEKKTFKLKTIVTFDGFSAQQKAAAQKVGIQIFSWEYLLEQGQKIVPYPPVNADTWFSLVYTSGTTGNPKAAILTHHNIIAAVGCYEVSKAFGLDTIVTGDVHLSYLPIAHIFERIWMQMIMARGVMIGFSQGDTQKLTEDMQVLKPSYVISVPRLYNKFYENFQNAINMALDRPIGTPIEGPIDPKILEELRKTTGGRAKFYFSASAPLSPAVHNFLRTVFGVPFMEGYGQTETVSVCNTQDPEDTTLNRIGGVFNNTEYKLVDLPEMNYTSKDLGPDGEPEPRGELCLRGPSIFKGYYKEPVKTAETIDKDGWHHTGDVAALFPKNGDMKLIDRKKNIFKLGQGEFVAPDKIANIYLSNKYVAEMYVYGDTYRSSLVGIVVPDPENLRDLGDELGMKDTSLEDLYRDTRVVAKILEEMNNTGRACKLNSYELVKSIYLEPQSLVVLGLTTPSLKLKRDVAQAHFMKIIEGLYESASTPTLKL